MGAFSKVSRERLATCEPRLVRLAMDVVVEYDCTILENGGARTEDVQRKMVLSGASKTMDSAHVVDDARPLSRALDLAPCPVVWPDKDNRFYAAQVGRFYHFAGYVKARAEALGIRVRWGGDWDSDLDFTDQTFNDLVHFELADD